MSPGDLKRFAPFAELSESDGELLEELLERRELVVGEVAFSEGDEADGLVLIESGEFAIENSRAGELGRVGPGRYFGGLSLASLGRRELSLTATQRSTLLLLPRSGFLRLSEDAPRGATRLLEALLRDIGSSLRSGLDWLL